MTTLLLEAPIALPNAVLVVFALSLAAIGHLAWLKSKVSARFSSPIDGGRTFRGKRIFGDNKRWRGLMALPVCSAASFAVLSLLQDVLPGWLQQGLWNRPVGWYALVGFLAGLVFMLSELPNSFLKRQLGVPPGQAAENSGLQCVLNAVDRLDSTLGVAVLLWLVTPLQWQTAAWLLLIGVFAHASFSVLQYTLGLKNRAL